jgi:hypothetical protein
MAQARVWRSMPVGALHARFPPVASAGCAGAALGLADVNAQRSLRPQPGPAAGLQPGCHRCGSPDLGSDTHGPQVANRTVVVGSATRDLVIADYSNFSLYAPGEPAGAVNIAGQDASGFKPATSFAAPYVALAAGILRSFGYTHAIDIRDRLAAATWPLAGVEDSKIGVVDLVKVAAVQQHAVEVLERGADGILVRRTYVGKLQERLRDLTLCTGQAFDESNVLTVRIDGDGPDRTARAYLRNAHDPNGGALGGRRTIQDVPVCRSQGVLHINAFLAGPKIIPLSSVTQIQLPWDPVR